jgi:dihydrolipoamide dehydrogenase
VPRCIFTDPELAHIGLVEADQDTDVRVSRLSFGALGKSHCDEETEGFVKLLVDPATDRIRGATIVGAQASSLIHYAVLAIHQGLTAKQLARTITAHPTLPEGITEAAASLYGESLVVASRPAARASHPA